NTYHRDGAMRVDGNQGRVPGIEPNSYGRWQEQPAYAEPALGVGANADRFDYREDDDNYFQQPGDLFRLMDATNSSDCSPTPPAPSTVPPRPPSSVTSATAPRPTRPTVRVCARPSRPSRKAA